MDLALMLHRSKDMFVGGFPKTTDGYFKRFALAMGYSATMLAKNRRKTAVVASKDRSRGLNHISPVCRMFKPRYCGNEDRTNLSPDDIKAILEKHTDGDDDTDDDNESSKWKTPKIKINISQDTTPTSPANFDVPQSSNAQKKSRKSQRHATLTGVQPIQLLNALLNAVQSEMLELTYDHFRLHDSCWNLLNLTKNMLDADLREIYDFHYQEKEPHFPLIVGYIFIAATQNSKLANLLAPRKKDIASRRLLVKAADALNNMLASKCGGTELLRLKDLYGWDVQPPDFMEMARGTSE